MPKSKNEIVMQAVDSIIKSEKSISAYKIGKILKERHNLNVNPKTITVVYCKYLIENKDLKTIKKVCNNRVNLEYSYDDNSEESYLLSIKKKDLKDILNYYKVLETAFAFVQQKVSKDSNNESKNLWKSIIEGFGFSFDLSEKSEILSKLNEIRTISKEIMEKVMNDE